MSKFAVVKYDFDEKTERRGTDCFKYDRLVENFGRDDLLPLWVADMDFRTPDFIVDALRTRLSHNIYGYGAIPYDYYYTISRWVHQLHGWSVDPDHIRYIPGIVKGIAFAQRCFLRQAAKVVIQPPVYHPFRITTQQCGFTPVCNPLIPVYDNDGFLSTYRMDLDGLDRICSDPDVRMIILSNPHNPCGISWDADTLRAVADIADRRAIIVVSDEIHAEMALGQGRHYPFASVSEAAARCSITFMAPTKTFNIAGIVSSYCIIQDEKLREKFFHYINSCEIDSPSIFSTVATMAAYTKGTEWRKQMLRYVEENINFVDESLRARIPQIHAVRPQASFLIWLDCRKLQDPVDIFINKAHLALNDGAMFGEQGRGFMRLNVGCPRATLTEALNRLEKALK